MNKRKIKKKIIKDDKVINKIKSAIENYGVTISDDIKLKQELFIESLKDENKFQNLDDILKWLTKKRKECNIITREVGVKDCNKWNIDDTTGNISHESRKFYTIMGIKVKGANREVSCWSQPMIKQHECGILGILCKKFNGIRHYLFYAKYEPGNMFRLQLSPTVQATESNLKLAHGGKKPLFAEYFEEEGKGKILTSVVGVEDGGRFYLKTNRSMVVEVDENEEINVPEDFIWLTMYQIKALMKMDNIMNSLARSVIASL